MGELGFLDIAMSLFPGITSLFTQDPIIAVEQNQKKWTLQKSPQS